MYHYNTCGLSNIYLCNGYEYQETPYGKSVSIKNLESLHETIGFYLAQENKNVLTGSEFRFLRKELNLSQRVLGALLGVSESTVRGWERNKSQPISSSTADRLLRYVYIEKKNSKGKVGGLEELLTKLSEYNSKQIIFKEKLNFTQTESGWNLKQAC